MNISRLAMQRPITTAMVFLSLLVFGLVASRLLPLEFFPEVDAPFVMVQVPYPGSSPRQVEEEIARPLEEALGTLTGIRRMNANSRADGATIFMEFDWGLEVAIKALEARAKLDAIRHELPEDVRRINVFKFSTSDEAVLTLRISSDRDLSNSWDLLNRKLVRNVQRLEGVARVELQGVEPMEVRIQLNRDRLKAHNIQPNAVADKLREHNFTYSSGDILDLDTRWRVQIHEEYRTIDDIETLVLNEKGLTLSDIADIYYGPKERHYGRHLDMHYAVGLEIFKERGANLVDVGHRVLNEIDRIGKDPEMHGIRLFFLNNQAAGVEESLGDLLNSGLVGALLSIVVLFIFLRNWLTTLTVSLAVPVSITITLGCMYFLGVSLNILSMMGLMLAVGMLVDNAVVVAESIFTERQNTPDRIREAAERGVRKVGIAVFAGTLTSAIVFLPNIFGEQNQITLFLSHVAYAITIALAASLLISLTVIPLVTSRMKHVPTAQNNRWIDRLKGQYARYLTWSMKRRGRTFAMMVAAVLISIIPASQVKMDMFPQSEDRDLFLRFNIAGSHSLEVMEAAVTKVEKYLYDNQEHLEIRAVYSYFDHVRAQSSILLTDKKQAKRAATDIKKEIENNLPTLAIAQPSFDVRRQGGNQGVSVRLYGESTEVLYELAEEVKRRLMAIDGIAVARLDGGRRDQEVQVRVDRDKAIRYGLDSRFIAQTLGTGIRGVELTEFRSRHGEVPVTLKFSGQDTQSLEDLYQVELPGKTQAVPLMSLVNLDVQGSPTNINRSNRRTSLEIKVVLADKKMDEVRKDINQTMETIDFPNGYGWLNGRGFEDQDETAQKMLFNMIVAVGLIYLVMAALFESIMLPISIVSSISFAIFGVFWLFWLTGTTFSLMAMIGILILIGVVVNNGIVLIDHINQLRWQGENRTQAIIHGGSDRLRPILMTVATTVLGLIPLAIGDTQIGGDGPPYFPMARAIIGGLIYATCCGLLFLPLIYSLLDDFSQWMSNLVRAAKQQLA